MQANHKVQVGLEAVNVDQMYLKASEWYDDNNLLFKGPKV